MGNIMQEAHHVIERRTVAILQGGAPGWERDLGKNKPTSRPRRWMNRQSQISQTQCFSHRHECKILWSRRDDF